MKRILLTILMMSTTIFAKEQVKQAPYRELMQNYLKSLYYKDKKLLKKISSNDFFKRHETQYFNKDVKQTERFSPELIEIKVEKAAFDKNLYRLKIKNKADKKYPDLSYIISKNNGQLIIERTEKDEE